MRRVVVLQISSEHAVAVRAPTPQAAPARLSRTGVVHAGQDFSEAAERSVGGLHQRGWEDRTGHVGADLAHRVVTPTIERAAAHPRRARVSRARAGHAPLLTVHSDRSIFFAAGAAVSEL